MKYFPWTILGKHLNFFEQFHLPNPRVSIGITKLLREGDIEKGFGIMSTQKNINIYISTFRGQINKHIYHCCVNDFHPRQYAKQISCSEGSFILFVELFLFSSLLIFVILTYYIVVIYCVYNYIYAYMFRFCLMNCLFVLLYPFII